MSDQSSKTTPLAATVFDGAPPLGPLALLGPALICAGLILAFAVPPDTGTLIACAGIVATAAHGLRPRRRARHTRVFCNIGHVRIAGGATLRARDIVGATTARSDDGRVSLALAHRRRKSPVIIDVDGEPALMRICKSLGIGHHGFGSIDAIARPTGADTLRYVAHVVTIATLLVALATRDLAGFGMMMAFASLVVAFVSFATTPPMIRMTGQGVYVPTTSGVAFAPFNTIERIDVEPNALAVELHTKDGAVTWRAPTRTVWWRRQGMSRAELEHIVTQLRAAVDRAHGKFVVKSEAESAAAKLRRAPGESLRAWLARIDTFGTGSVGYREMALDAGELWTLLEDPEAHPDTRAAAARMLSRVAPGELKVRIANVLATARDKNVRTRISASIDEDALEDEERAEARTRT
jgi:hypothetical protein